VVVKVTDSHGATSTARWTVLVSAIKPALTLTDSDQDHLNDVSEGLIDSWNTGLPDYLNPFDESFVIPDRVINGAPTQPLETQPGLSLHVGAMSLAAGGTGALLVTPPADTGYQHTSGVFDFEIRGVPQTAGVASIVLPLQTALDSDAVYRQYVQSSSGWHAFTSSGADAIYSAPATNGACPGPDSATWTTGLSAKAQCLRLTLTDGGPNDADGVVNGTIVNAGGAATTPSSSSQSSSQPSSGVTKGGGAVTWIWLWMLGALLIAVQIRALHRGEQDHAQR
jgi:hypothetical protein